MFGSVEATASTKRFRSLIPPLETRHRVSHDITWDFLTFPFFFKWQEEQNFKGRRNCNKLEVKLQRFDLNSIFFFFSLYSRDGGSVSRRLQKTIYILSNCRRSRFVEIACVFFLAIITNQQMSPGGSRALFGVWEWSGDAIANASAFCGQSRIECSYLKLLHQGQRPFQQNRDAFLYSPEWNQQSGSLCC